MIWVSPDFYAYVRVGILDFRQTSCPFWFRCKWGKQNKRKIWFPASIGRLHSSKPPKRQYCQLQTRAYANLLRRCQRRYRLLRGKRPRRQWRQNRLLRQRNATRQSSSALCKRISAEDAAASIAVEIKTERRSAAAVDTHWRKLGWEKRGPISMHSPFPM